MPIFEFVCEKCGQNFEELILSSSATPVCPKCASKATSKLISAPVRHRGASSADSSWSAPASGGGCAGCSGGNCASCGH